MNKFLLPLVFVLVLSLTVSPQLALALPGDIIVVELNGVLKRVSPDGSSVTTIASGFGGGRGVDIDSSGDFIVCTGATGTLLRVTPAGVVTTIASGLGFSNACSVATDSSGDFVVADFTGTLFRVTPAGVVSTITSGLSELTGVDIDSGGDFIVVSQSSAGTLFRVTPSGVVTTIATGVGGGLFGIAIDSGGDFIVPDQSTSLLRVTPAGVVSTITSSLGIPRGVSIDLGGNFIVSQGGGSGDLVRVTPAGVVSTIVSGLNSAIDSVVEPQPTQVVGGTLIPIDTTALLLASAQSFSWMIPLVLSILGIGLFVVSRKSE